MATLIHGLQYLCVIYFVLCVSIVRGVEVFISGLQYLLICDIFCPLCEYNRRCKSIFSRLQYLPMFNIFCPLCVCAWYFFMYYHGERETNISYLVVSSISEGGHIHLNPAAILFTPTLHFERQSVSFLLKPTFILSSSTCFFHILFGLPFLL